MIAPGRLRNLALGAILGLATAAVGAWVGVDWARTSAAVVTAKPSPSPSPSATPDPYPSKRILGDDRVLSISSRSLTLGHACPISSSEALTADHVSLDRDALWGPNTAFAPYLIWGDALGNWGTAAWKWSDVRRDLSLIRVVDGTPLFSAYLRQAKTLPRVGDRVYVVGFKFGKGAGDWTSEAKVTGITAGLLIYETTPGPGSSGSCVLNADGEFVAINVWRLDGEGAGVLVVGDWGEVPDPFLEGSR